MTDEDHPHLLPGYDDHVDTTETSILMCGRFQTDIGTAERTDGGLDLCVVMAFEGEMSTDRSIKEDYTVLMSLEGFDAFIEDLIDVRDKAREYLDRPR